MGVWFLVLGSLIILGAWLRYLRDGMDYVSFKRVRQWLAVGVFGVVMLMITIWHANYNGLPLCSQMPNARYPSECRK
jgi:hypothetical protein